jgi:ribose transport system substrate-binding protein
MRRKIATAALAALAMIGVSTMGSVANAQQDPGPGAYDSAMKGKKVVLVPMAMGFDLAQGWAY